MTDPYYLHKAEMDSDSKIYEHHPRVLFFRPTLRRIQSKADQIISSYSAIPLPIHVKRDKVLIRRRRCLFGWHETGQRVLYVT